LTRQTLKHYWSCDIFFYYKVTPQYKFVQKIAQCRKSQSKIFIDIDSDIVAQSQQQCTHFTGMRYIKYFYLFAVFSLFVTLNFGKEERRRLRKGFVEF